MTHGQNFMREMAEAYQALEREPERLREIDSLRSINDRDGATIARLELKLMDRANEIEQLQATLRSVEAERDDAGFRELEAQDKLGALRRAVEGAFPALGQALAVTSGDDKTEVVRMSLSEIEEYHDLKAQMAERDLKAVEEMRKLIEESRREAARPPESSPQWPDTAPSTGSTEPLAESGERAVDPTVEKEPTSSETASYSPVSLTSDASSVTEGVSVSSDPTASDYESTTSVSLPLTSPSPSAPDDTVSSQDGAETLGKYHGKNYRSWPAYVSEPDWIAGGGTSDSYWEGRERSRF